MNRRDALALVSAFPAAAQEIAATLPDQIAEAAPAFLSAEERAALTALASQILPAMAGKPGALECGVVEFLDFYLSRSSAAEQQLYRDGLRRAASQPDLIRGLDQQWTYAEPADPATRFLRRLKEDVLRAAFNSRVWIEQSGRRGGGTNYYFKAYE